MDNPALIAWAARGLRDVLLPSGTEVRIRIPEADYLIRKGLLPDDLLGIASRFVTTGVELDKSSDEDRLRFNELTRHMVARMVRAVKSDDGWQDIPTGSDGERGLTVEQLDEFELPADDLRSLELVARRQATPEAVSAAARGMIATREAFDKVGATDAATEPEPARGVIVNHEEAGDTVDGWAEFPGQPESAVDREGGGAVQPVAGTDVPTGEGPGDGDDAR